MLTVTERISRLMELYREVVFAPADLEDVLGGAHEINILCLRSLIQFQRKAIGSTLRMKDIAPRKNISSDIVGTLCGIARSVLERYTTQVKYAEKKVILKNTNTRAITTLAGECGYLRSLDDLSQNKETRKPYLQFYNRTLDALHINMGDIVTRIDEYIEKTNTFESLSKLIAPYYEHLVDDWNKTDPILKLKKHVDVKILPGNFEMVVTFETTSGRKFKHKYRNVTHWLIDGYVTNSSKHTRLAFLLDQTSIALRNPTVWITLDNYTELIREGYVDIHRVDQDTLDPTGNVAALSISFGSADLHESEYVFYQKKGETYEAINSNTLAAKRFVQRMELAKRLTM